MLRNATFLHLSLVFHSSVAMTMTGPPFSLARIVASTTTSQAARKWISKLKSLDYSRSELIRWAVPSAKGRTINASTMPAKNHPTVFSTIWASVKSVGNPYQFQ